MKLKKDNNLLITKMEEKYSLSLKKIDISPFPEGMLVTDNYFILQNKKVLGFMVIDTDDKIANYDTAFAVTTSPNMNFGAPRSLFCIEKFFHNSDMILLSQTNRFITESQFALLHIQIFSKIRCLFETALSILYTYFSTELLQI